MKIVDKELKYELKELLEELIEIRGQGTELISVYIPDKFSINEYMNMLNTEKSESNNIKSKQTRKNVQTALDKIIAELKKHKKTPENGLIIFCGNIGGSNQNIKLWTINPLIPSNKKLYRCDQIFWTDALAELIQDKEEILIASIDKQEMAIATIKGKRVIPITKKDSLIPGKFRAGGQSAARFQRQRQEARISFLKDTGKKIQDSMRDKKLKKIILGGPGPMKEELNSDKYLGEFSKKVIGIIDSGYSGVDGFEEILSKCHDILIEEDLLEEKNKVKEFLTILNKNPDKSSYGLKETLDKLSKGVVKTVFISEKLSKNNKKLIQIEANNYGTIIELISTDTNEGKTLFELGGVGAILRYEIRN